MIGPMDVEPPVSPRLHKEHPLELHWRKKQEIDKLEYRGNLEKAIYKNYPDFLDEEMCFSCGGHPCEDPEIILERYRKQRLMDMEFIRDMTAERKALKEELTGVKIRLDNIASVEEEWKHYKIMTEAETRRLNLMIEQQQETIAELKDNESELKPLLKKLKDAELESVQLKKDRAQMQDVLNSHVDRMDTLAIKNESLVTQNTEIRGKLVTIEAELAQAKIELKDALEQLKQTGDELKEKGIKLANTETIFDDYKSLMGRKLGKHEQREKELLYLVEDLSSTIRELEQQTENSDARIEQLMQQIEGMQEEMKRIRHRSENSSNFQDYVGVKRDLNKLKKVSGSMAQKLKEYEDEKPMKVMTIDGSRERARHAQKMKHHEDEQPLPGMEKDRPRPRTRHSQRHSETRVSVVRSFLSTAESGNEMVGGITSAVSAGNEDGSWNMDGHVRTGSRLSFRGMRKRPTSATFDLKNHRHHGSVPSDLVDQVRVVSVASDDVEKRRHATEIDDSMEHGRPYSKTYDTTEKRKLTSVTFDHASHKRAHGTADHRKHRSTAARHASPGRSSHADGVHHRKSKKHGSSKVSKGTDQKRFGHTSTDQRELDSIEGEDQMYYASDTSEDMDEKRFSSVTPEGMDESRLGSEVSDSIDERKFGSETSDGIKHRLFEAHPYDSVDPNWYVSEGPYGVQPDKFGHETFYNKDGNDLDSDTTPHERPGPKISDAVDQREIYATLKENHQHGLKLSNAVDQRGINVSIKENPQHGLKLSNAVDQRGIYASLKENPQHGLKLSNAVDQRGIYTSLMENPQHEQIGSLRRESESAEHNRADSLTSDGAANTRTDALLNYIAEKRKRSTAVSESADRMSLESIIHHRSLGEIISEMIDQRKPTSDTNVRGVIGKKSLAAQHSAYTPLDTPSHSDRAIVVPERNMERFRTGSRPQNRSILERIETGELSSAQLSANPLYRQLASEQLLPSRSLQRNRSSSSTATLGKKTPPRHSGRLIRGSPEDLFVLNKDGVPVKININLKKNKGKALYEDGNKLDSGPTTTSALLNQRESSRSAGDEIEYDPHRVYMNKDTLTAGTSVTDDDQDTVRQNTKYNTPKNADSASVFSMP